MIPYCLELFCFLVSVSMSAIRVQLDFILVQFLDFSKELYALKMSVSSQKSKIVQQYERKQKQSDRKQNDLRSGFRSKVEQTVQALRHDI